MGPKQLRGGGVRLDAANVDLKPYDGCSLLVMLGGGRKGVGFYGVGEYQRDPTLGNVLHVRPPSGGVGDPSLVIAEQYWEGTIEAVDDPDAEYRFVPSPRWPPRA